MRTGYERIIAHRCGRLFAGVAEKDGKITNIDEKTHLVEITYEDGTVDLFPYGEHYVPFQGFYATHNIDCVVTVGQSIKKGDILTYNKGFFNLDKRSKQLDMTIGDYANVAFIEMDSNLEDAGAISKRLADKMNICPTNRRDVVLSKNSLIHSCAKIGDHVKNIDTLMVFEEDPGLGESLFATVSDETQTLLGDINRSIPEAKFNGEVVKIEAHYGCPISEMHPSLAAIVRNAVSEQNRAARMAAGTLSEEEFPPNEVLPEGLKFNGTQYDEDTVVISFYIRELETTKVGDKIVLGLMNKGTISSIFSQKMYTETGDELDVLWSSDSCSKRIVLSPYFIGIITRIVQQMEKNVADMYFED